MLKLEQGRPADTAGRLEKEIRVYDFLDKKIKEYKLNKTTYFEFKIESNRNKLLTVAAYAIVVVFMCIMYYGTLTVKFMQNDLQTISNKNLILTNDNPNLNVSQFGVYAFGFSDMMINTFDINADISGDDVFNNNQSSVVASGESARNIDDSAWKELINNEKNSTYNKLNNYFISREITPKNDKTGIYEGKNLIVILLLIEIIMMI